MSVYTIETLVESYPAYDVYKREPFMTKVTQITADDLLGLEGNGYYSVFSPGSVASYALSQNKDPISAVEDAKAKGHSLYWLNSIGTALTSHKQQKQKLIKVEAGMLVHFQGVVFTIENAPNNNLKLVPFTGDL